MRLSDKRLLRRILYGKVGLVVLLIIFVLFAKGTWGVYKKASFAKENRIRAEDQLRELREHEAVLSEELEKLKTERGMEEAIREKFDVGREGEHLIVLVDVPQPAIVPEAQETTIWSNIKGFFTFGE